MLDDCRVFQCGSAHIGVGGSYRCALQQGGSSALPQQSCITNSAVEGSCILLCSAWQTRWDGMLTLSDPIVQMGEVSVMPAPQEAALKTCTRLWRLCTGSDNSQETALSGQQAMLAVKQQVDAAKPGKAPAETKPPEGAQHPPTWCAQLQHPSHHALLGMLLSCQQDCASQRAFTMHSSLARPPSSMLSHQPPFRSP